MSLALTNRVEILRDRAAQLAKARAFFAQRGVLEVDVPILSPFGSIDPYIDLVEARCRNQPVFLHSSPEYGMKRLLAEGLGDIYQMSHVFRDHENGERHTAEFMMVEWYRLGLDFQQMIQETVDFIRLFLDVPLSFEQVSYKNLFESYPASIEERDEIFGFKIEPLLGEHALTVVLDFPPEQAALSQIGANGMAQRFEIFSKGIELANGYLELIEGEEQKKRLLMANQKRIELGKSSYPIDNHFLEAFDQGIPECCGVAVGFDRLMMLRLQMEDIHEASSFFI